MGDPTQPVDHRQRAEDIFGADADQARHHGRTEHEVRDLMWALYHAMLAIHDELRLLVQHAGIRR